MGQPSGPGQGQAAPFPPPSQRAPILGLALDRTVPQGQPSRPDLGLGCRSYWTALIWARPWARLPLFPPSSHRGSLFRPCPGPGCPFSLLLPTGAAFLGLALGQAAPSTRAPLLGLALSRTVPLGQSSKPDLGPGCRSYRDSLLGQVLGQAVPFPSFLPRWQP